LDTIAAVQKGTVSPRDAVRIAKDCEQINQELAGKLRAAALLAAQAAAVNALDAAAPLKPKLPRYRDRTGRCYEITGKYILDNPDSGWHVVQGYCTLTNVAHAWLECSGWAYDVISDEFLPAAQYRGRYSFEVLAEFESAEAFAKAFTARGAALWGPLHDTKGLLLGSGPMRRPRKPRG
jgi:hypothetical protein